MTIVYDTPNAKFLEEIMSVGKPNKNRGTLVTSLELNEDIRVDEVKGDVEIGHGDHVVRVNTTLHANNKYVSDHLRNSRSYSLHPAEGQDSYDPLMPGKHKYGKVIRTTSQHAHIKWDDGTETKNRLSNGTDVAGSDHNALKISGTPEEHHAAHVEAHKERAVKNAAMRDKFAKEREERETEYAAKDRTRHITNRIHSHTGGLSPEHAEAIHRILDEAGMKRDKDGDEARAHIENPKYGVDPRKSPEHLHGDWMKRRYEEHENMKKE